MKIHFHCLAAAVLLAALPLGAQAQKLSIFADQKYQPVLEEIVGQFSEQTGFAVELSLGRSTILAERLRQGIPADVFFPASEDQMRQVMEKGLVDVALKRNILVLPPKEPGEDGVVPGPEYTSAAVLTASTNRLQAMAFLEFLSSEPARAAFTKNGFTPP